MLQATTHQCFISNFYQQIIYKIYKFFPSEQINLLLLLFVSCGRVWSGYLGGLQGAGHQGGHTADVSEDFLAADVGPPRQIPQDAGDHLVQLLAVWGQLGHQSLEAALLRAQSGLKEDEVEVKQTELSDWHGSVRLSI